MFPLPSARNPPSLALRIQLQIGLAVALVVAIGTFLIYRQTIGSMRDETLQTLSTDMATRAAYESTPFVDAQQNTIALRQEYLRRLNEMGSTDPRGEFDMWFTASADGVIRVRPERDDHQHLPSIYIRPQAELTPDVRRQVLVAFRLLREWGPMLTRHFYSAYVDLPGISLIMFSPSVNWGREADKNTNNFDYPPVQNSAPSRNPARQNLWTRLYFDDKAGIWMLSTTTPVDIDGQWVGSISQDISIEELLKRTTNEFAPGSYNMIIDGQGSLVAHPDLMERIRQSSGKLKISTLGDSLLAGFAARAAQADQAHAGPAVQESPDGEHYLGIARIRGPDWYLVTVYPKSLLLGRVYTVTRSILMVSALGLVSILLLLAWIIRRQVAAPLGELNRAAAAIAGGNLDVVVNIPGRDELGQLGASFTNMAGRLRERDFTLQKRAAELESEISERKLSEQRMRYMATHDALTGLANRMLLMDRLQQAIVSAERNGQLVALLFIDLDHFKHINDTLGHDMGDEVLKRMALKISLLLRKSDTLCRLGGDEFVLLLPLIAHQEDAVLIAGKIIVTSSDPVNIDGTDFTVTPSIGISVHPADGLDGDVLLRNADIAMYRAKAAGRNGYQCYTPDMGLRVGEALRMETAIRQAIEQQELVLYFQPKVSALDHRILGAEALVRWNRPGHGQLSPVAFLPFAEERNLMLGIDRYVLERACSHLSTWQKDGCPLVPVAVNLSASHFARSDLLDELGEMLARYQIAPRLLQLEVTEGTLLQEGGVVVENLAALRRLGVRISVDDFGTGFSSLSYLHRFPVDEIKIDRSFVSNIGNSADDVPLVRAIIGIGHDLKLSLVAEGVETQEQATFLRQQGCDELQGYFFFRPMPDEEFMAVLQSQRFAAP